MNMNIARKRGRGLSLVAGVAMLASPAIAVSASATTSGDDIVINEVYAHGGERGAAYSSQFVELYNPTAHPISLNGMVLGVNVPDHKELKGLTKLTGTIAPKGHYLIKGVSNGEDGKPRRKQIADDLAVIVAFRVNAAQQCVREICRHHVRYHVIPSEQHNSGEIVALRACHTILCIETGAL